MAKISANKPSLMDKITKIFNNPQAKLISLRKKLQWVETEKQALPEIYKSKKQRKLGAIKSGYDAKLSSAAFKACDKEEYATAAFNEKMQAYDVKAYMQHRAANHALTKSIFAAIKKGEDYSAAVSKHDAAIQALKAKRARYEEKLLSEKAAFIKRNNTADDSEYVALKAKLQKEYDAIESSISEKYNVELEKKTAKLNAKIEKLNADIQAVKSTIPALKSLPENVLLSVKGLKMYFGGLKAVDDLTFDVKKGEIFGLIGPNGAGKTTVFNCITRFYNATGGDIYFENKAGEVVDMRDFKVHDVILQGISRTFQNVELVKEISVLENLLVACTREYQSNFWVHALGLPIVKKEEKLLKVKAMKILKFMGIENYASWLAMGLPYGILKKVEIARALMSNAKLIIMDEPAAGLNDSETAELTQTIRKIRDEFNVTILLVEHDMGLVMSVCDTVCAISFGKMLAIGTCEEIQKNKAVQEAYLGVEEDE